MESSEDYLKRKHSEIRYISSIVFPDARPPWEASAADVIRRKKELKNKCLAKCIEANPDIGETGIQPGKPINISGSKIEFAYQRFDMKIDGPDVYPNLSSSELCLDIVFTNCGMSAVASTLLSLARVFDTCNVVLLVDTYFETQHFVSQYLPSFVLHVAQNPREATSAAERLCQTSDAPVLLVIDSFTADDPTAMVRSLPKGVVDLILFDTTCYSATDKSLDEIAKSALRAGTPVVLVRSHIKLDCLGVEYLRLGSICISIDWPELPPERRCIIAPLQQSILETVRMIGCTPSPLAFVLPRDAAFHALNDQRISRIRENTLYLERMFECDSLEGVTCRRHHHQIFTAFRVESISTREGISALVAEIGLACARERLPVHHAGSFGFDFISIDEFVDLKEDAPVLRVCPADLPIEIVEAFYKILAPKLVIHSGTPAVFYKT